jgi:non-heme Fe2+,alpha-ketoglutarate-dependent halogenase
MGKSLNDEQVAQFKRDGFLFPIDVYKPEEAAGHYDKFAAMEKKLGHEPQERFRIKAHLPFPWLCDIVKHPAIVDAIEDIIGPNVLCWGASFFTKQANDPRFVSWHTDTFYYGFEPAETVTAWLPFNDANLESGCIKYIPGSHKQQTVHEIIADDNNLVQQGQNALNVPVETAVDAILKAGQVVLHHESVVHGSGPNNANHARIGFSIHYIAPTARETRFDGATAMLLRGENVGDNWGIDPEPSVDYDQTCIDWMDATRAKFTSSTASKIASGGRS